MIEQKEIMQELMGGKSFEFPCPRAKVVFKMSNRRICLLGALPKQQSASDPVFFNKTDTNMPSHVS